MRYENKEYVVEAAFPEDQNWEMGATVDMRVWLAFEVSEWDAMVKAIETTLARWYPEYPYTYQMDTEKYPPKWLQYNLLDSPGGTTAIVFLAQLRKRGYYQNFENIRNQ